MNRESSTLYRSESSLVLRRDTSLSLSYAESATLKSLNASLEETSDKRLKWLRMATDDTDRAGDVLLMSGMIETNFSQNPQYLWEHGLSGAVVSTLGKILKTHRDEHTLYALAEYAPEGTSELADQIYKLDAAGLLPANSVGFSPKEFEPIEGEGYCFKSWELIECSKVTLPMNPNAIDERALKSLRDRFTRAIAEGWFDPSSNRTPVMQTLEAQGLIERECVKRVPLIEAVRWALA